MIVVVQNDRDVPIGTYGVFLEKWQVEYRIVSPYLGEPLPPLPECSAVIVLGGALGVHDTRIFPFLCPLKKWIRGAVRGNIPFLGICLGGQLLADVSGGQVYSPSSCGERGFLPVHLTAEGYCDPLFAGLPTEFMMFQWHDDAFSIPPGGALLASSAACPNQAFRLGRNAYALQFHPEVDREIISTWGANAANSDENLERLLVSLDRVHDEYQASSAGILANFLHMCPFSPHITCG